MAKLYEEYLKELFGPNPTKIYVSLYNEFSDCVNSNLHSCERGKFGGNTTKEQNHYCYYSAVAKCLPSFISALKYAAEHKCKGNRGCSDKLMNMARRLNDDLENARKLRDQFKKKI